MNAVRLRLRGLVRPEGRAGREDYVHGHMVGHRPGLAHAVEQLEVRHAGGHRGVLVNRLRLSQHAVLQVLEASVGPEPGTRGGVHGDGADDEEVDLEARARIPRPAVLPQTLQCCGDGVLLRIHARRIHDAKRPQLGLRHEQRLPRIEHGQAHAHLPDSLVDADHPRAGVLRKGHETGCDLPVPLVGGVLPVPHEPTHSLAQRPPPYPAVVVASLCCGLELRHHLLEAFGHRRHLGEAAAGCRHGGLRGRPLCSQGPRRRADDVGPHVVASLLRVRPVDKLRLGHRRDDERVVVDGAGAPEQAELHARLAQAVAASLTGDRVHGHRLHDEEVELEPRVEVHRLPEPIHPGVRDREGLLAGIDLRGVEQGEHRRSGMPVWHDEHLAGAEGGEPQGHQGLLAPHPHPLRILELLQLPDPLHGRAEALADGGGLAFAAAPSRASSLRTPASARPRSRSCVMPGPQRLHDIEEPSVVVGHRLPSNPLGLRQGPLDSDRVPRGADDVSGYEVALHVRGRDVVHQLVVEDGRHHGNVVA
mmetsp:Transcript_113016/g.326578  ORF Transcript_113016/g.326578 Transcript_113016/m.326578 type:complete len:533 (+) Transcript_113016:231-1829(+)